jgi:hypothetical protein
MGRRALFLAFLPALVAGLFMGFFLSAYPSAASGKMGYKARDVEYSSPLMGVLDEFLVPVFFIFMVLFAMKLVFQIRFLGLVSALMGYSGMVLIMSGSGLLGLLFLVFGGIICFTCAD